MKIVVLSGDGIGPEVTAQSIKVLRVLEQRGLHMELSEYPVGGTAYDSTGHPLPPATLDAAKRADAILFGAEGGLQYEALPRGLRPGDALLTLRKTLNLFANHRPVVVFDALINVSPFRPEVIQNVNILIVRELISDLYFGEPRGIYAEGGRRIGVNTMRYTEDEIARVAHVAFAAARKRKRQLCSVDKANVLESMELWRTVVNEVALDYPDVQVSHLYVDAAAMALTRDPGRFDVVVTGNLFGDILSDAAAMLTGSIGMLPSASINLSGKGLYEPVHGCAPDIAGRDIANPLASILSLAMMLRLSFAQEDAAYRIERAVCNVLADGKRTADIHENGCQYVGTDAMGSAVAEALKSLCT